MKRMLRITTLLLAIFSFTSTAYTQLTVSASATTECLGSATTFTGSAQNGTPTYSYLWDFGDGNTSTMQNPTNTYTNDSSYTVILTVIDAVPDTVSDTITVVVNPIEDARFGYPGISFCELDTNISPIGPATPGGTFSGPAGLTLNATTGGFNPSTSTIGGPYTITYTTGGTCAGTSSFDVSIVAQDIATISYSKAEYCLSEANPTPTITGATGGEFSGLNGIQLDNQTGEIDLTLSTAGQYTVTYETSGNCGALSTFDIELIDGPSSDFMIHDISQTQKHFMNAPAGMKYEWDLGDGTTSTDQDPTHTYAKDTIYTVCLIITDTAGTGCSSTTCKIVNENTGINSSVIGNYISVYPVPTNNFITVEVSQAVNFKTGKLVLYNLIGEIVHYQNISSHLNGKKVIDVSHLPNGNYILNITSDTFTVNKKIVIAE